MFGAIKVLVPIGVGLAGLVAFASKSNAKTLDSGPKSSARPRSNSKPSGGGKLTLEQVVQQMTAAVASADPQVINQLADKLEQQGFPQQAADLRGVANALSKVGAVAAGTTPPAPNPAKPATPITSLPPAPSSPAQVSVPAPVAAPPLPSGNVTTLPEMTISPISAGERAQASSVVVDQQSKPKWKDNRDKVAGFQNQESAAGRLKNIVTGAPGVVDGLYGPGTAIDIAENFGIVPPNPKYWPVNPAPSLAAYKRRLTALAAADPARAAEWNQAAAKAKVVK